MSKYFLFIIYFLIIILTFNSCKQSPQNSNEYIDYDIYDETMIGANKYIVKENKEKIESYIKRRSWDMQQTGTGLWYQIYHNGKGQIAQKGLIAVLNFSVELLDGTLCYSSEKDGQKKFKIGQGGVESGLEQGLLLMKKGDKARFIMPPYMAHGFIGDYYKIPSMAIIVYDVELVDLQMPSK